VVTETGAGVQGTVNIKILISDYDKLFCKKKSVNIYKNIFFLVFLKAFHGGSVLYNNLRITGK